MEIARLKAAGFEWNDPVALASRQPLLLAVDISIEGSEGSERFYVAVMTLETLRQRLALEPVVVGYGMVIVDRLEPDLVERELAAHLSRMTAEKEWGITTLKVSRLGQSEYDPRPDEYVDHWRYCR